MATTTRTKTDSDVAQLEKYIEAQLGSMKVPGVAVAIIRGEEVLMSRGFGARDIRGKKPMTEKTVMPIGSVTKSFTSALLATLVDDGLVEWDKPVREYLPGLRMHDPVATENLTLRDMLSHRSGLPRHDMLWYGNEELTRAEVVKRLPHLKPNVSFRQLWQYNNLMYITAGHLAELLLDMSWEEAVRTRLLEPLGMSSTTFTVAAAQAAEDHSRPYVLKEEELLEVPYRGLDLAGPAGSINSNAEDMSKWASLHANGGRFEGRQVLSPTAIAQLHSAAMVVADGTAFWPENTGYAYAMGWMLDIYRGQKVVQHGGNIDGFSSMVSVLPAQNLAVVVLTNRHATPVRDYVPYRVYDQYLGLEPIPWDTRFRELTEKMIAGAKEAKVHRAATAVKAPPAHTLEDYAGRYSHPGYGDFTFRLDGDQLVPSYGSNRMRLTHSSYEAFELELEPFDEGPGLPVIFTTDFDGEVAAVRIPLEASVDPIEFLRQPDPSLGDATVLERYTGAYSIGPIEIVVRLDGDDLYVQSPGAPRQKLTPKRPRMFTAGKQRATVEFVETDGRVTRMMAQGASFERSGDAPKD